MFASPVGVDGRAASFFLHDVCRGIHACGKEAGVQDALPPYAPWHTSSTWYYVLMDMD